MKVYRQGDVVIKQQKVAVNEEKKDLILAEGEMTGHAHRVIEGQVKMYYTAMQGMLAIKVLSEMARIGHEEHADIILPMGDYTVEIQREYDWVSESIRRVAD